MEGIFEVDSGVFQHGGCFPASRAEGGYDLRFFCLFYEGKRRAVQGVEGFFHVYAGVLG